MSKTRSWSQEIVFLYCKTADHYIQETQAIRRADGKLSCPVHLKPLATKKYTYLIEVTPTFPTYELIPLTPAVVAVGVASAQALAENPRRKSLVLVNTSGVNISLGLGRAAVLNSGITLLANGGTWNMDKNSFTTLQVNAIAGAAASNLSVQEFE